MDDDEIEWIKKMMRNMLGGILNDEESGYYGFDATFEDGNLMDFNEFGSGMPRRESSSREIHTIKNTDELCIINIRIPDIKLGEFFYFGLSRYYSQSRKYLLCKSHL